MVPEATQVFDRAPEQGDRSFKSLPWFITASIISLLLGYMPANCIQLGATRDGRESVDLALLDASDPLPERAQSLHRIQRQTF